MKKLERVQIRYTKRLRDVDSKVFHIVKDCVGGNCVLWSCAFFCVALCTFVIGDRKDSKFDVDVKCASHSLRTTNRP